MLLQNTAVSSRLLHKSYFEYCLDNGLHSNDELADFIEIYFGLSIPRTASSHCPQHQSPFEFIADQFFERITTCLGFANRTGGKTKDVAILNALDMLFKPGVDICSAGAVKDQAQRGYEYLSRALLGLLPVMSSRSVEIVELAPENMVLTNDSRAQIITMSYTGLNSPHPAKFRADEIELVHWDLIQEAFSMTQGREGMAAQDTFTSTRKIATGTMQRLLDEASDRAITIKSWCLWETVERCTRQCKGDPEFGDCPIYSRLLPDGTEEMLCGGIAHDVPGGYFTITDLVKKAQNLDKETFEAQWLCIRPGSMQLVYGTHYADEPPFLVRPDEQAKILERYKKDGNWVRGYGVDFGSNFALGAWIRDPLDEIWYKYWEYFFSSERDRSLAEHAENVKTHDPLGFDPRSTFMFGDPAGRQQMRDLEEYGFYLEPANNDLGGGVNFMKAMLQRTPTRPLPKLRYFDTCRETRREMSKTYLHPVRRDGTVDRDKVVARANHCADSDRYLIYSFYTIGTGQYRMRTMRGI